MKWIYQMNRVRVSRSDKLILDDVTLAFLPGAKIGVVGPNGAGKSTLLKIMAGVEQPSNGEVTLASGASVGILLQEPPLDESKTVLGNVEQGVAQTLTMLVRFTALTQLLAEDCSDELLAEMGRLQEQLDLRGAWDLDSRLEQAMNALRCPPGDAEVGSLPGGQRRRVALCALLLRQPDLLLLDEPTNHLDAESVQWLEQHLEKYPGTVVAVTHDRYFLDHVAEWVLELDRGHAYPYQGNYSTYLENKQARLRIEGNKDAKRHRRLQQELEWVRAGAKAHQTKNRSRLQRYEQMATEADKRRTVDFDEIQIPPGPRLGNLVIEAHGLSKRYGDRVLLDDLSFSLPRNGIVGVLGPNGVGKTTLFRILARAYLAAFGFKGPDQQKPARLFSGGERNRLNLALTLQQGGNLLLLDEPTNDLDVDTLSSLENALLDFPGCALITAHDRWFLDRVATHILAWEGTHDHPGQWFWFEGNFEGYANNKIQRLGTEAARPHRVTYRKLTRE